MLVKFNVFVISLVLLIPLTAVTAETRVQLTAELSSLDIIYNNAVVTIKREQNSEHTLNGTFAMTSRPCPPACITAIDPIPGINIVGELELFTFLEQEYLNDSGLLIDARSQDWFKRGTIPGSINLAANQYTNITEAISEQLLTLIDANQRYDVGSFTRFLEKRGILDGTKKTDEFDFTHAKKILIWDNGPWSDSAAVIIQAFAEINYPAEYIYYYHGGMQSWQTLGLTIVKPK